MSKSGLTDELSSKSFSLKGTIQQILCKIWPNEVMICETLLPKDGCNKLRIQGKWCTLGHVSNSALQYADDDDDDNTFLLCRKRW